jgi:hypothetical protein
MRVSTFAASTATRLPRAFPAPDTAALPDSLALLAARYGSGAPAVLEQLRRTHDCSAPIRLAGERVTVDRETGEILARYGSDQEPSGYALLPCGNRRASRCPACSKLYRGDAFALIRAGLAGDEAKGVPAELAGHPRVFVTFTAPSFGPVHGRVVRAGRVLPCRARRDHPVCSHGLPTWCALRHAENDPALGQPLCPECFDYEAAVLWNAHVPALWRRTITYLPRILAAELGVSRTALRETARISFAKVAEFQSRGLVHLHAIFRIDGPDQGSAAPPWATSELLADVVAQAVARTSLRIEGPAGAEMELRWGVQFDVRAIQPGTEGEWSEARVAAYVAKYATKAAESAGGPDRRLRSPYEIERLAVTDHARRLITTCWTLGGLAQYEHLRLRAWAHMLGFRGHFLTKGRRYSVTFGALRTARVRYRTNLAMIARGLNGGDEYDEASTLVIGHFAFAGVGMGFMSELAAAGGPGGLAP